MQRRYSEWDIPTNGITTRVSEWGEGDRHAVLLHGVSGNRMYWTDLAPRLAAAGWHVWAPDLRGAAGSRVEDDAQVGRDIDTYVADLAAWTEAAGISRFTLAGHSFGGRLAAQFAALHQDRVEKLILIAAAGPDAFQRVAQEHPELYTGGRTFHELAEIEGPAHEVLGALRNRSADSPAPRACYQRWFANIDIDRDGYARHHDVTATAQAQMEIIFKDDQSPLMEKIQCPTLVLRSVDEGAMIRHTILHYVDLIPNATLIDDIPGGHDAPTAAPDVVFEAFS
ncbi:MAG: alpha/beta hydrolase [Chloroflexota bacterium]